MASSAKMDQWSVTLLPIGKPGAVDNMVPMRLRMLSRNRDWYNKIIYNVTIYKPLKWTEPTTLKLPLAAETLIWLHISGWEGVCRDRTITTSFCLVNLKTFVNDTLSSGGIEKYYLENAQLFWKKLLSCCLTAFETRSQFWSMNHPVYGNKPIH